MSVRTIMLGLAACAVAAPALAATTTKTHMPMHHSMAMHTSMSHKGHMMGHTMGHMGHGSPVSADNSADELNAKSLKNAQGGGMMAAPAPAMPAPAPAPAGGT